MSSITFVAVMALFILYRPVYPTVTVGMDASLFNSGYNTFIKFKNNNTIKKVQYGHITGFDFLFFKPTDTHLTHASIMLGAVNQTKNSETSLMIGIGTIYGQIEDKTKLIGSCSDDAFFCFEKYGTKAYSSPMMSIEGEVIRRSFLNLGFGGRFIFAFKDAKTFFNLYISLGLPFSN